MCHSLSLISVPGGDGNSKIALRKQGKCRPLTLPGTRRHTGQIPTLTQLA